MTTAADRSDEELRSALESPDPVERLLAAWELAVRTALDDEEAIDRARNDPSAGVRRDLTVLLAGRWQLDVLRRIAVDDPSPRARATACAALSRLVPIDPAIDHFLAARLGAESSDAVRVAIVDHVEVAGAPRLAAAIGAALADPCLDVREAAVGRIRDGLPVDVAALTQAALREEHAPLRLALAWLALAREAPIAEQLDGETLAALVRGTLGDGRLPPVLLHSAVRRWCDGEDRLLDGVTVHRLLDAHFDEIARPALLQLIAVHVWANTRWDDLVARCRRTPLDAAERRAVGTIAATLLGSVDESAGETDERLSWCRAIGGAMARLAEER